MNRMRGYPSRGPAERLIAGGRPVVETTGGQVCGVTVAGVSLYKGIPYANALRFTPPVSTRWDGVHDAAYFGPTAPQAHPGSSVVPQHLLWIYDSEPRSEDCLVLNVFAPTGWGSASPVMVFLHGGGFANGSASPVGLDGTNLAGEGAVIVTLNHRLNIFGHLFLGAHHADYADSGNVGLLDIVSALEWVRENIEQFGGDPHCVTIFGQSGGGSKVAALLAMPAASGLFHRAIIQSASSMLRFSTLEESERNTQVLLDVLANGGASIRNLQVLPTKVLVDAIAKTIWASGGVDNFRPVIDGRTLMTQPFDKDSNRTSASIPLLIGWCENEQRAAFSVHPEIFNQSHAKVVGQISQYIGIPRNVSENLMSVYSAGRPGDSPGDIMSQVYGDHRYRRAVTRGAESRVIDEVAPTYMYMITWRSPVLGGMLRSPHMLCLPFVFRNVDRARSFVGAESDRHRIQDEMSSAWIAFARKGNPACSAIPPWPRYDTRDRPTMVFSRRTAVVLDPAAEERKILATCPQYSPAEAEGGRRR